MAQFKPIRTTSEKLSDVSYVDGQLILITDTRKLYSDIGNGDRIKVGGDTIALYGKELNYDYFQNHITENTDKDFDTYEYMGNEDETFFIRVLASTQASPFYAVVFNHADGMIYEAATHEADMGDGKSRLVFYARASKDNIIEENYYNFSWKKWTVIFDLAGVYSSTYEYIDTLDISIEDFIPVDYINIETLATIGYVNELVGDIESVLERLTTGEGV